MKIKGRGAQHNPQNPYEELKRDRHIIVDEDLPDRTVTQVVYPKSIVNKVPSPDVGMAYSINPYQGCEHGCVYCYARNSHAYWGYSAGLDFEQKIMVKPSAPDLLQAFLTRKSWDGTPIALSGNTDCYQPLESKWKITRQLLKTFARFEHPTGIITKNARILRDMDIITELASKNLVRVAISINTLDESLRRQLEPRTSTIDRRAEAVQRLAAAGVPTMVMIAPVIPGLNSHDVMPLVQKAAEWGASQVGYIIVRLNGAVQDIFSDWIDQAYPLRATKVLNQISSCHGGSASDSRFFTRMKGEGPLAHMIRDQFKLAVATYMPQNKSVTLDRTLYLRRKNPQLSLF